jgi:murein L,D-transpeptidase YcbB/YkuD
MGAGWRKGLGIAAAGLALAANSSAADDAVAPHLRERLQQVSAGSERARAIAAFYEQRQYAPVWQDPQRLAALATAVGSTRSDGLDPQTYHYAQLTAAETESARAHETDDERARIDLLATDAYLLATEHLHWGELDPHKIDPDYNFAPAPADRDAWRRSVLAEVDRADIDDVFAQARPQHQAYARLRGALQKLRDIDAAGGWPTIADGPTLKRGDVDPRVAPLRSRLQFGGYEVAGAPDDNRFDASLEAALRQFQEEQYLNVDGKVGAQTRAVLNLPVRARIDQVRVNLERARWLLRLAQGDFVLVDVAGFKVTYFEANQPVWSARAQIGMPYRSTPSFRSKIDSVTFNPTWTVPPTILGNDLLPKIRRNPATLAANRIRVFDGAGHELDPAAVDWNNPRGITLRQDAGADNSLGRVAIRFSNPYGVYMHDTPHKDLFAEERRAFSSGCIRIERPLELVEHLFAGTPGWNREKIDALIAAGATKTVMLERPLPILILYWSVETHDERIAFKPDIYGKDRAILNALDRYTVEPLLEHAP